jgi:predicted Mrr-cat superfamily restriction endonuclease
MGAFVLRMTPLGIDRLPEALRSNEVTMGWGKAAGLLDPNLDWCSFRQLVHDCYYAGEKDYTNSGRAAGNLWRFIREMSEGDLVVVPYGPECFIARVIGPPRHDQTKADEETAYRRRVAWLNDKKPLERSRARAALQSRMKAYQTCADATDLVADIEDLLQLQDRARAPSFKEDLRRKLLEETQKEICSGRLDSYGFERLVVDVLSALGGTDVRTIPRRQDKGVDILATFHWAHTFKLLLGVQAKHFQPHPPVSASVVDQLAAGMEAEGATFGWVVTSGTFSEEATTRKREIEGTRGLQIELIDGQQLAAMVVETGLR